MTFRRRKLKQFAFLKFDSEEDCSAARDKLAGGLLLKNGECIGVNLKSKRDNVTLFLPLSIRGGGPRQVLNTLSPKDMIEDAVKSRDVVFKEVFIPKEPAMDTTNEVVQNIRASLSAIVNNVGIASSDYGVTIRPWKPWHLVWEAGLTFSSFSLGLAVATHLKDTQEICWTDGTKEQQIPKK